LESIFTINKNLENALEGIKKIEINTKRDNKKDEERVDNHP